MEVLHSKGLPQGNEVLSGFDSWWRVQVVTNIESDWANGRGIPDTESKRIRVLTMEPYCPKDISSVVEPDDSQPFLNRDWNSKFRVHNQELIASRGDRDGRAHRRVVFIADGYGALLAGTIQGKSTQCAAASSKELFAYRNVTVGKSLEETYSDAVRPYHFRG